MDVMVIGGGLGGLALASGLRQAGIPVTVLERDDDLAATGGYHITLQTPVQNALARLLPEHVSRSSVRRRPAAGAATPTCCGTRAAVRSAASN